jgi:tripartite-type tricarboxylate transporter receptor subunit TctC
MRGYHAVVAFCALTLAGSPAGAQSVADFYKGKEVTLIVGAGAGGGYDVYARLLARHWPKHIPGNPTMVVQYMPTASGMQMLNHLTDRAPKDGTVVGAAVAATVIDPVGVSEGVAYDPRKLSWIGNVSPQVTACFIRTSHPVKTVDDAKTKEVIVAATSPDNAGAVLPNVFNILLGTKFKVVRGYSDAEMTLSVERAETDAACLSLSGAFAARYFQDAELQKKVSWFLVLNNKRVAQLPNVPTVSEYIQNDEGRQIVDLLISRVYMGRPFVAGPGVPADRLDALRKSFFETLKDPELVEEAKKARLEIDPIDHAAMEKLISAAYATPPATVQKTYALMKGAEEAAKAAPTVQK